MYTDYNRSPENIDLVLTNIVDEPEMSISRRSKQVELSETTIWRMS